jgi:hypothetical protein
MKIFTTARLTALLLLGAPMFLSTALTYGGGRFGYFRRHRGEPITTAPSKPVMIIRERFFCFPHNLGFGSEAEFFEHLQTAHHVSREHAPAHLLEVGNHVVFFSF